MAIKNTNIYGKDWQFGSYLLGADLNDTFDQIVTIVDAGN